MELRDIPRVREIIQFIRERVPESYVVGGAIRDQLMGKSLRMDLDLAVPCNGFDLARDLAQTSGLKATFVPLDATFGTGRIVLHGTPPALLDISSFKGANIEDDLRRRDFTINAMAVSVRDFLEGAYDRVIDPTGGIKDLRSKTIRACSNIAFVEDPLRNSQGVSLSGLPGLCHQPRYA